MMSVFNVSDITSKIHTTSAKGRGERKKRRQKKDKKQNKKGKEGKKEKRKGKKKKSTLHQLSRVIVQLLGLLWQSAWKVTESAISVPQCTKLKCSQLISLIFSKQYEIYTKLLLNPSTGSFKVCLEGLVVARSHAPMLARTHMHTHILISLFFSYNIKKAG